MKGRDVPVAARIEKLNSMSAHAESMGILRWLEDSSQQPDRTFLVHGEPAALDALKTKIETEMKWPVHVARQAERVDLGF